MTEDFFTEEEKKKIESVDSKMRESGHEWPSNLTHPHWILDENKQAIKATLGEWAVWLERDPKQRQVALKEWDFKSIRGEKEVMGMKLPTWEYEGVMVSTVFLGLDHNFFGKGPPILFESMIFGGPYDGEQRRYSTWDEAEEGHAYLVALAQSGVDAILEVIENSIGWRGRCVRLWRKMIATIKRWVRND